MYVVAYENDSGGYRLPVDDDTILFVIKPRGWMTPLSELNLPRFYHIHKPNGSPKLRYPGVAPTGPLPESIDFPLYPHKEPDRFRVVVFGDTQPNSIQDINYLAHDVVEEVIGTEAAFGFTLGDLVNNGLNLFEPLNRTVAHIGNSRRLRKSFTRFPCESDSRPDSDNLHRHRGPLTMIRTAALFALSNAVALASSVALAADAPEIVSVQKSDISTKGTFNAPIPGGSR